MAPTKDTIEARLEALEQCHAECRGKTSTAIAYLKWIVGASSSVFLIIAGTAYVKADRAGTELSTQAQIRFAQQEERYIQIQKDLKALDRKIDERFAQIRETLNSMKGSK